MNAIMTDPVLFVLCMAMCIWIAVGAGVIANMIDERRFLKSEQKRLDAKYDEYVAIGKDMSRLTPAEQRTLIRPMKWLPTLSASQLKELP